MRISLSHFYQFHMRHSSTLVLDRAHCMYWSHVHCEERNICKCIHFAQNWNHFSDAVAPIDFYSTYFHKKTWKEWRKKDQQQRPHHQLIELVKTLCCASVRDFCVLCLILLSFITQLYYLLIAKIHTDIIYTYTYSYIFKATIWLNTFSNTLNFHIFDFGLLLLLFCWLFFFLYFLLYFSLLNSFSRACAHRRITKMLAIGIHSKLHQVCLGVWCELPLCIPRQCGSVAIFYFFDLVYCSSWIRYCHFLLAYLLAKHKAYLF